MRKWVLSGILASEETYLSHLEALLLVSTATFPTPALAYLLLLPSRISQNFTYLDCQLLSAKGTC